MKKVIILLMMVIFIGCDLGYNITAGQMGYYKSEYVDPEIEIAVIRDSKLQKSELIGFIAGWVSTHITYRRDIDEYGIEEHWQSPEETYIKRSGDCEDMILLYMYLIHRYLGCEPILRVVKLKIPSRIANHAMAVVNYEGIEYIFGEIESAEQLKINYEYSYWEAMYIADRRL